jgi:hypothetical protein
MMKTLPMCDVATLDFAAEGVLVQADAGYIRAMSAELARLRAEVERLTAAADALREAARAAIQGDGCWHVEPAALAAYDRARGAR